MVERFHREFKTLVMARQNRIHWISEIPIVLLEIRAGVKKEIFIRVGKIRSGLLPPYELPYKVIHCLRKVFGIKYKGKHSTIFDHSTE